MRFAALAFLVLLAACAEKHAPPPPPPLVDPARTENACEIFATRPDWREAVETVEKVRGTPTPMILAFVRQESNFHADKRSPKREGPFGYAQAVRHTWGVYRKDTDRAEADRNSFPDAVDFIGWYLQSTHDKFDTPYSNVRAHYLAYSRGHGAFTDGKPSRAARKNANRVADFAKRYAAQLADCPAAKPKKRPWWAFGRPG